jgi:hypothetical protein
MVGPDPFLLWEDTLTLRTGAGFNTNPALSPEGTPQNPSGFVEYGGDLTFFRLPSDGNSAFLLLSGDDRRYFNSASVPGEQTFIGQMKFDHASPSWWNAGGSLTYLYAHQVFDLSDYDAGVGTSDLRGQTVTLRPTFSARISTNWLAGFELPMTRQGFTEPADGYFEVGPQLLFARMLAHHSQVSIGYSWTWRPYDNSPLLTPNGEIIPGSTERLRYNSVLLRWQQNWNEQKTWTTTLRSSFTTTRDNGEGYYDYNRIRVGGVVRYQKDRWTVSVEGGAGWYNYLEQTIAPDETELRERQEYLVNLRAEFNLTKSLKCVASFTWEKSDANIPEDTYSGRTASAGLEWEY